MPAPLPRQPAAAEPGDAHAPSSDPPHFLPLHAGPPAASEARLRELHEKAAAAHYSELSERHAMLKEQVALLTPDQAAKLKAALPLLKALGPQGRPPRPEPQGPEGREPRNLSTGRPRP